MDRPRLLTIGEVAERSGVSHSALRFYERQGLIESERTSGNQRRYHRDVLRLVGFIRVAQRVGLTLGEISESLSSLPTGRAPTRHDWSELSTSWRPRLDDQIETLIRLRDKLGTCIGCGCLSLDVCDLLNPEDSAASIGAGPRYVLSEDAPA